MSSHTNGYRELSTLGKGTFGDVYKVRRGSDCKLFAMKKIRISNYCRLDRLEKEVESHKSLPKHPNVLEFIEYFETSGCMHIVLELCDLGNLEEYITTHSVIQDTAVSFMVDMAHGLNHLHSHGIVHRDIKPENILLVRGAQDTPRCKISDFGVANMSSYASDMDKTGSLPGEKYYNTLCGTPLYLAPEVTARHYTKSCDIFSLGVVFYTLFSPRRTTGGRLAPWVKNGTIFYRAKDYEIKEEVREHVSDEKLSELISSMLKVDYHDRISAPAVEEKLMELAVKDDEVFLVACVVMGVCLMLVLFPFPLVVLCVLLLVFVAKELFPKGVISTML